MRASVAALGQTGGESDLSYGPGLKQNKTSKRGSPAHPSNRGSELTRCLHALFELANVRVDRKCDTGYITETRVRVQNCVSFVFNGDYEAIFMAQRVRLYAIEQVAKQNKKIFRQRD